MLNIMSENLDQARLSFQRTCAKRQREAYQSERDFVKECEDMVNEDEHVSGRKIEELEEEVHHWEGEWKELQSNLTQVFSLFSLSNTHSWCSYVHICQHTQ